MIEGLDLSLILEVQGVVLVGWFAYAVCVDDLLTLHLTSTWNWAA